MYKFITILKLAFRSCLSYKLRSLLSVASIALGISGVTIVVASINGAHKEINAIFDIFGSDTVSIVGGGEIRRGAGFREYTLTPSDVDALYNNFPTAYVIAPLRARFGISAGFEGKSHSTFVVGATGGYSSVWNWPILEGRDFTAEEVSHSGNKCILGNDLKEELFGLDESPVGQYITLQSMYCEVIGVLTKKDFGDYSTMNDRVIIPITTLLKRFTKDKKYLTVIRMRFEDVENLDIRIEEVKNVLRQSHGLVDGDHDDFFIYSANMILETMLALTGSFVIFLSLAALICMIVGGFVMANLFFLSVQERITEIGIKRAFGATKLDIFAQFIFEFIIIMFVGAIAGFFLGYLLSFSIASHDIIEVSLSISVFFAAMLVSLVIALIFGALPARRAANVDPIVAIRS